MSHEILHEIIHVFFHVIEDTLKTMPYLYLVYLLLEILQKKMTAMRVFREKSNFVGPVIGALTGCFPQCGFSAAAASLYSGGAIGAGTLIAVFLSTSDAALPLFLADKAHWGEILPFLGVKVVLAVIAGYILEFTVFRKDLRAGAEICHDDHDCHCCHDHKNIWLGALNHTLKISLFVGIVLFVINLSIHLVGTERVGAIMLEGSIFQPMLAALIGLIPGCGTSVVLTELYLSGTLSFGSAIAGLSTGAGFGFLVLFRENRPVKDSFRIAFYSYICAAIGGMLIQFFIK